MCQIVRSQPGGPKKEFLGVNPGLLLPPPATVQSCCAGECCEMSPGCFVAFFPLEQCTTTRQNKTRSEYWLIHVQIDGATVDPMVHLYRRSSRSAECLIASSTPDYGVLYAGSQIERHQIECIRATCRWRQNMIQVMRRNLFRAPGRVEIKKKKKDTKIQV